MSFRLMAAPHSGYLGSMRCGCRCANALQTIRGARGGSSQAPHFCRVGRGVERVPVADLDYAEDSSADSDMNVVMTESGGLIEVQGTAEGATLLRKNSTNYWHSLRLQARRSQQPKERR